MADNKQRTEEQLSNDILKAVFQELHSTVVSTINASSVIHKLFSAKVISDEDINDLDPINYPLEKCRHLLSILHNRKHPRAFIELRQAIHDEDTVNWFVEEIDEKYNLLASEPAQLQHELQRVQISRSKSHVYYFMGSIVLKKRRNVHDINFWCASLSWVWADSTLPQFLTPISPLSSSFSFPSKTNCFLSHPFITIVREREEREELE